MKLLSIVLPCYNPPKDWEQHVLKAILQVQEKIPALEVIIVDDGSTKPPSKESIAKLEENLGPDSLQVTGYDQNKGKGYALRHGVSLAEAPYIIYTDIDFPYTTESLLAVWKQLQEGADVVAGVKSAAYYQNVPKMRILISRFLRRLIRFFFRMPITDTQCGLKGFKAEGKSVFINTTIDRYLCDLEFIYKCYRSKTINRVVAQPVELRKGVVFSKMNWKILLGESFSFLKILSSKK